MQINFICDQIKECGLVNYRKMFGEYMIYLNQKPIILVCDDTPYIKINELTTQIIGGQGIGVPYKGAREHYIVDVDDQATLCRVVRELEKITPFPKSKQKKITI